MIGARRVVLGSLLLLTLVATPAHAFNLDDVAARAAKLAASPYQKPGASLPKAIKALDYDQFRDIRFRPERALWRNSKLPFEIMFFHRGWFYEDAGHDPRGHAPRACGTSPSIPRPSTTAATRSIATSCGGWGSPASGCTSRSTPRATRTRRWSSWGPATSGGSDGASGSDCPRAGWPSTPPRPLARSSRGSWSSGSSARSRRRRSSPFTRCWTRRGRPAPTASSSSRA